MSIHIDWHCVCGDGPQSHVSRPDGEYCHGHCQKTERDCDGRGYRPADHQDRTPAITALFAAAERENLPHAYTCDLSTDYQTLMQYDGAFISVLRTNGTELYPLDNQPLKGLQASKAAYRYWVGEGSGSAEYKVFLWNGLSLLSIAPELGETLLQDRIEGKPLRSALAPKYTCHGPTWHNANCTHRAVSVAPSGDHTHGAGVMACSLCAPAR